MTQSGPQTGVKTAESMWETSVETRLSDFFAPFVSRLQRTGRQSPELSRRLPPPLKTEVQLVEVFVFCLLPCRIVCGWLSPWIYTDRQTRIGRIANQQSRHSHMIKMAESMEEVWLRNVTEKCKTELRHADARLELSLVCGKPWISHQRQETTRKTTIAGIVSRPTVFLSLVCCGLNGHRTISSKIMRYAAPLNVMDTITNSESERQWT